MKKSSVSTIFNIFIKFSCRNFVRGADGSYVLEEFLKNSKAN